MSEVPIISIDEVEDLDDLDDDMGKLNINDCHTDVEELDSDQGAKNSLIDSLKKELKCNGAVTDVEDCEDSGDEPDDHQEQTTYPEFSLNEFLDQGMVDEHSNLQGNVSKTKLQATRSVAKSPSPTAFHLTINQPALDATTDVEDMETSGEEIDEDKDYSDDEKAIILEGANMVDVHDSMNKQKKPEKYAPRVCIDGTSSSSESENEKCKAKLKTHHYKSKKNQRCEEAKSDVENIYFSDDDNPKKKTKSAPVLDTPDIEVMAFEGSDADDIEQEQFPEINITFVDNTSKKKRKIKPKKTPAPSLMLKLPENQDEAVTDVENLNSSDDDDDGEDCKPLRPKTLMPIAVIKSDALTDVEDFDDDDDDNVEDDMDINEKREILLPTPTREFTVLVENKSGEPFKQTTPLPDNIYLGFEDLDADKGLTDVEDFADESGSESDDEVKFKGIDQLPDLDGGYVESSDHAVVKDSTMRVSATPEPKTDTEDIYVKKQSGNECRRRKTKSKHNKSAPGKSLFLDTKFYVDNIAESALTDVEDLDLEDDDVILKDKNVKQRRATTECPQRKLSNCEAKTDTEFFSDEDGTIDARNCTPEYEAKELQIDACSVTIEKDVVGWKKGQSKMLDIPMIRRMSATPRSSTVSCTDVEQFQCESDDDEISYSRAQTATPHEISQQLNDSSESQVHDIHSTSFDTSQEYLEIKGHQDIGEAHTDVEFLD